MMSEVQRGETGWRFQNSMPKEHLISAEQLEHCHPARPSVLRSCTQYHNVTKTPSVIMAGQMQHVKNTQKSHCYNVTKVQCANTTRIHPLNCCAPHSDQSISPADRVAAAKFAAVAHTGTDRQTDRRMS